LYRKAQECPDRTSAQLEVRHTQSAAETEAADSEEAETAAADSEEAETAAAVTDSAVVTAASGREEKGWVAVTAAEDSAVAGTEEVDLAWAADCKRVR
jgi:hypothetical protein